MPTDPVRFTPDAITAAVSSWRPQEWADPQASSARVAFLGWAARELDKRTVSDAQLAGRYIAFLAGWRAGKGAVNVERGAAPPVLVPERDDPRRGDSAP